MKLLNVKAKLHDQSFMLQAKCASVCAGVMALASNLLTAHATPVPTQTPVSIPEGANLVNNMTGVVFMIFRYIGILLLAWSIGSLVLAFKNEDADSKSRSMMMAVCAICLIAVKSIFSLLGITA